MFCESFSPPLPPPLPPRTNTIQFLDNLAAAIYTNDLARIISRNLFFFFPPDFAD